MSPWRCFLHPRTDASIGSRRMRSCRPAEVQAEIAAPSLNIGRRRQRRRGGWGPIPNLLRWGGGGAPDEPMLVPRSEAAPPAVAGFGTSFHDRFSLQIDPKRRPLELTGPAAQLCSEGRMTLPCGLPDGYVMGSPARAPRKA